MSSITESFSSGVGFQYSAVASMFISSSLFYFFIAHLLPVNIVGSISLLYAIMNIMAVVFVFGLSNGIQHYISYHLVRENHQAIMKLMKQTIVFAVLLALSAFIFMYIASPEIASLFFHSTVYILSVKLIGIAIAGSVMINIFGSMLLGLNQYKKYSIIYIFINIFTYFFPLSMLFLTGKSVFLIAGLGAINILSAISFFVFVYRAYSRLGNLTRNAPREPYRNLIYYSVPLFLSSIMGTSATYIDRIVVSYFINLSYLGIYNFALIIASAATFLVVPVSNLLIPKLSTFFSLDNKDGFRSSIRILLNIVSLIYVPAALGIAALSRIILYEFAGSAYTVAYIPLMIIMFITSFFIGTVVLSSGISSIRKTKIFVYSSGLSLSSNIVLSVLLIPAFNIIGAAIAYSSMNAVNFAIVYHYARKFGVNNYDVPRIIKIWLSSLIMFGAVFIIQGMFPYSMLNIFLYIILGAGIYLLEIKAFHLISSSEMDYILSVIPDRFSTIKYILRNLEYSEHKGRYDRLFRFIK
ncbi:MAG: polysaccharide biosynthesis C-terminal domain-containing protein [Ferroplasma sp.]|uniref:oligosaccharide flippase family protein n=1 Tax=Ferroplasma sp. TaxID=2591003 RepID=UPI002815B3D5|nr:polysaccharide biosynthesis C-terminal domain-containing protein [Ferroplasma sp.]WMT50453.1 MAG: polysaccharide biosynthesis C-terminal domain-containing protein [Ferroplasma sp.]